MINLIMIICHIFPFPCPSSSSFWTSSSFSCRTFSFYHAFCGMKMTSYAIFSPSSFCTFSLKTENIINYNFVWFCNIFHKITFFFFLWDFFFFLWLPVNVDKKCVIDCWVFNLLNIPYFFFFFFLPIKKLIFYIVKFFECWKLTIFLLLFLFLFSSSITT